MAQISLVLLVFSSFLRLIVEFLVDGPDFRLATAASVDITDLPQMVVTLRVGEGFSVNQQSRWRCQHGWVWCVEQPTLAIEDMGPGQNTAGNGRAHGLLNQVLIVLQHQGQKCRPSPDRRRHA